MLALTCVGALYADDLNDLRKKMQEEIEKQRAQNKKELEDFREQINREFAEHLKDPWKPLPDSAKVIIPRPVEPPVPPVIIKDDEPVVVKPQPKPVVIDTVIVAPKPKPQPAPVEPIPEPPTPTVQKVKLNYFGTPVSVSAPELKQLSLKKCSENDISNAWKALGQCDIDLIIADCLKARTQLALPDWGYFQLVDKALGKYYTPGSNEHTLAFGYVLTQSGYMVRFCVEDSGKLHALLGYDGLLFDRVYYTIDGTKFYPYDTDPIYGMVRISGAKFQGERPFSININASPKLQYAPGNRRVVNVKNYPDLQLTCTPNKNLIDFWAAYPSGTDGDNQYTRWAVHGNTPLSEEMKSALYPALRAKVKGMNQADAANVLIKVAQSFEYGYDDDIWGHDRAFWVEESWHYPKSDCEDHAIHFSRLIRDILGLDVALIYYPGHLSAAVCFTDGSAKGDYINYKGKPYTVCDATCFYGPVGYTPKSCDNSQAIMIPLAKK